MKSDLLLRPIITEKAMKDVANNRFTFAFAKTANKSQILEIISKTFNVKPLNIKTIMVKGKSKISRKTRETTKLDNWKKAIIQLPKDQKIDLFDKNA